MTPFESRDALLRAIKWRAVVILSPRDSMAAALAAYWLKQTEKAR